MDNLRAVPLAGVAVTDEYCRNAQRKEADYLLSLSLGRLLAGFYENAGIKTSFVRYGGWESGLIGGHTLGHYLSALAHGGASGSFSKEVRAALCERAQRAVSALSECQTALGSGLIWGAPPVEGGAEGQFDNLERGKTDILREAWVPYYTLHKLLAGLLDIFRLLGLNEALTVARGLGDWVVARTQNWSEALNKRILETEYGGMNEALYELFSCTGEEKYARAARRFDEEELFDAILTEGKDVLCDLHENTAIPKILGALRRYTLFPSEGERYLRVAESFFRMVSERHTYVTGGSSEWEHFGRDGVLDAERTACNCETCVSYNMMKLARGLFLVTGKKEYSDFYENAFTNSILSSIDPETGMTTYFQPMASGYFKVFSSPYDDFWCCTGSGMENFTRLGEGIWYRRGRSVYVEQYLSSVLDDGVRIAAKCDFPFSDTVVFTVERAAEPFLLCLRIPDWAAEYPTATRGGRAVKLLEANGHLSLMVAEGDVVEVRIPVEIALSGLPDGKNAFAFRYGGAVLSADLGREDLSETTTGVSVRIPARRICATDRVYFENLYDLFETPSRYFERDGERFLLRGGDIPLTFGLHYRRFRERYALYLRLCEGKREEEKGEREPLDAVQPGYGQYEKDGLHAMEESCSESGTARGNFRRAPAGGWFSYRFKADPSRDCVLVLTAAEEGTLVLTSEGETLFEGTLSAGKREVVLTRGQLSRHADGEGLIRLRFEGKEGSPSPALCDSIYIY